MTVPKQPSKQFRELLDQLHNAMRTEDESSEALAVADALRNEMDPIWNVLTSAEQDEMRKYSAQLYKEDPDGFEIEIPSPTLKAGDRIHHNKFGNGEVEGPWPDSPNTWAVLFDNDGSGKPYLMPIVPALEPEQYQILLSENMN